MNKVFRNAVATIVVLVATLMGCTAKQIVHDPATVPQPQITLSQHLDHLYKDDPERWEIVMARLVMSEEEGLPKTHLINAIEEFDEEDQRQICLAATFLYLRERAKSLGLLSGYDASLFERFVEYSLSHTASRKAVHQIDYICRYLKTNQICDELQ